MKFTKLAFISVCATLSIASSAADVNFAVSAKPGGLAGILAESLSSAIKEVGNTSVEVKYLGTCQVSSEAFKQDSDLIFPLPIHIAADQKCGGYNITKDNMIAILQRQGMSLCSRKDRPELGLTHFLSQEKKTLGVINYFAKVGARWANDTGGSTKIVSVGISSDLKAATFNNEVDYFMLDMASAVSSLDRLNCMFNTTDSAVTAGEVTILPLTSLKTPINDKIVYASQMLISGSKKGEHVNFINILTQSTKSETWKKYTSRPGTDFTILTGESAYKFYTEQEKLFK